MEKRSLTDKATRFIERVAENPERSHATSARLAGYSVSSSSRMPSLLFSDPRVVAALYERGITVLKPGQDAPEEGID